MQAEDKQMQHSPLITRLLITGGIIAPLLFMLVLLIEGATRPGYNAWAMTGSLLSLSDQGWMQIANFIVCGLLILGFAIGLKHILRGGRGATWGPILIGAVGAGFILAGIFVTDPALGYPPGTPPGPAVNSTLHGSLHWFLGGFVVFTAMPASCFVLARRFASDAQWKGWALPSVLTGILIIAFFVTFAIASMHDSLAGLWELISLGLGMVWIALVAFHCSRLMSLVVPSVHSAGEA